MLLLQSNVRIGSVASADEAQTAPRQAPQDGIILERPNGHS